MCHALLHSLINMGKTALNVDQENAEEPVGYDYYKIYRGSMTEPIREWDADIELRFATEEEQTLLLGNSDSESECAADDDDDSNDENNWRNDYPDEEDDDDDDTEDEDVDYYDDDDRAYSLSLQEDNEESPFALERMRRRLEGFAMEAYEGEEDISDDDDNIRGEFSAPSNEDDDSYDDRYRED
ncbi:unnamed protein product [Strongylus vulgaris]|uniref:Transcription factor Iwr1 domain-containing protein n=1 Tax=Strongylus vulgaris TaxID=40348 RepID=A0A3P7HZE3_STRVU|nr:unnamed protein product [Strongylus vulgaris]